MEKIVLKATDFQLGLPLVDSFAEFFDHFSPTPLDKLPRHMMWSEFRNIFVLNLVNFAIGQVSAWAVHPQLPCRPLPAQSARRRRISDRPLHSTGEDRRRRAWKGRRRKKGTEKGGGTVGDVVGRDGAEDPHSARGTGRTRWVGGNRSTGGGLVNDDYQSEIKQIQSGHCSKFMARPKLQTPIWTPSARNSPQRVAIVLPSCSCQVFFASQTFFNV